MNWINWIVARATQKLNLLTILTIILLISCVYALSLLNKQNQLIKGNISSKNLDYTAEAIIVEKPAEQLFLETVPDVETASLAIEALNVIADENGFELGEVRYKDEIRSKEPVLRYSIDFEINGQYEAIKSFLSELLVSQPYMSLQKLMMHRNEVDETSINAQFKMMLILSHE